MKLSSNFGALKQALDHEAINEKLEELARRVRSISQPQGSGPLTSLRQRRPMQNNKSMADLSVGSPQYQVQVMACRSASKGKGRTTRSEQKEKQTNRSFLILKQTRRENASCLEGHQQSYKRLKSCRINYAGGKNNESVSCSKENDDREAGNRQPSRLVQTKIDVCYHV